MKEDKENITMKSEILKSTDGYREGAIAGGLVGMVIAAYLKKNIIVGVFMGMMVGGYVMYSAKNDKDNKPTFNK